MEPSTKIRKFLDAYKKLVEEYEVDFASYPVLVPNEEGKFVIVVQSTPIDLAQQRKLKENGDFTVPKSA